MGSFDAYRKYARDCFAMAQTASDGRMKAFLFTMAQSWVRLAQQAEKNTSAARIPETRPLRKRRAGAD